MGLFAITPSRTQLVLPTTEASTTNESIWLPYMWYQNSITGVVAPARLIWGVRITAVLLPVNAPKRSAYRYLVRPEWSDWGPVAGRT